LKNNAAKRMTMFSSISSNVIGVDNALSRQCQTFKEIVLSEIDIHDVYNCVNKLKLKKAAGHDDIMSEHIVYGGTSVLVHLCLLFNAMLMHAFVPNDFWSRYSNATS
jgi:hypothetical protein